MSARKRFDKDLYNQNDLLCRNAVKELLNTKYLVKDNPKKMGVDLEVFDLNTGVQLFNIECERKSVWNSNEFKYENVQFPERKRKYAQLPLPTVFVMFNNDMSNYLTVTGTDLVSSQCVEVPNKYVFKGEKFFQVSLTKVHFNNIKNSIEEILK